MPLTDAKVKNLKVGEKPYKVSDFDGFYVLVKKSGSKSWRFKYRMDGREKLLVIGDYPSISLMQARRVRDAARADVASGIDPNEAKQDAKRRRNEDKSLTFEKQADAFFAKSVKEGKAEATLAKSEWLLNMAKADFGQKAISEITSPMVLKCLRKVEAKGNYETARRLRAKIGAVFRYAIANGVAEVDPTFALRDALIRPTVKSRSAITDPKKLGGLLRAIDGFEGQPTTRIALLLLALLAQRPGELRHATWAEFDVDAAIWSIPADRMKMRRPHRVPLPKEALWTCHDFVPPQVLV